MAKPCKCIVEGCDRFVHAKGYCRRHYGQIWRKGFIYNTSPTDRREAEARLRGDANEKLRSLDRELRRAQQMYDVVVGFQGRIKWRREIEALQLEMRKLIEQGHPALLHSEVMSEADVVEVGEEASEEALLVHSA